MKVEIELNPLDNVEDSKKYAAAMMVKNYDEILKSQGRKRLCPRESASMERWLRACIGTKRILRLERSLDDLDEYAAWAF
jgi:hypothetical protein